MEVARERRVSGSRARWTDGEMMEDKQRRRREEKQRQKQQEKRTKGRNSVLVNG